MKFVAKILRISSSSQQKTAVFWILDAKWSKNRTNELHGRLQTDV